MSRSIDNLNCLCGSESKLASPVYNVEVQVMVAILPDDYPACIGTQLSFVAEWCARSFTCGLHVGHGSHAIVSNIEEGEEHGSGWRQQRRQQQSERLPHNLLYLQVH